MLRKVVLVLMTVFVTSTHADEVSVDIGELVEGKPKYITWGAVSVVIYRRTSDEIAKTITHLEKHNYPVVDNSFGLSVAALTYGNRYANEVAYGELLVDKTILRPLRDDIFVAVATVRNSACLATVKRSGNVPLVMIRYGLHAGFHNPCTGDVFDLSGRHVKSYYTRTAKRYPNMYVPPHRYESGRLIIGMPEQKKEIIQYKDYCPWPKDGDIEIDEKLVIAARCGDLNVLKQILGKYPSKVNVADKSGRSLLLFASYERHDDMVDYLLSHPQIDIDAKTKSGFRLVGLPRARVETEFLNKILKLNPSLNPECDMAGCFHGVLLDYKYDKVTADTKRNIKLLLSHGAEPTRRYQGKTILEHVKDENPELYALLEEFNDNKPQVAHGVQR